MKKKIALLMLVFISFLLIKVEKLTYASTNNIDLEVRVTGNATYDGIFYIETNRFYENKTGTNQTFSERLSIGEPDPFGIDFVEVMTITDGLSFEKIERGFYEITGELKPFETKSIKLFQISKRSGRGKGRDGESFAQSLQLLNVRENINPRYFNVRIDYPENITKLYDSNLYLVYWNDEEADIKRIKPETQTMFPSQSWTVTYEDSSIPDSRYVTKADLANVGRIGVSPHYSVRLNKTPNYLLYLAFGLAVTSFLYTLVLSRRLKKFKGK